MDMSVMLQGGTGYKGIEHDIITVSPVSLFVFRAHEKLSQPRSPLDRL